MKKCSKCGVRKLLKDFYKNRRSADGHRYSCKECDSNQNRNRRNKFTREDLNRINTRQRNNYFNDRDWRVKDKINNPAKYLLKNARRRANDKGLLFDLDQYVDEIEKRINKMKCEVTGVTLRHNLSGIRSPFTPSLDRINPDGNYTYDNIRIVCWAVNCAFNTWGQDVFNEIFKGYLKDEK